MKKFIALLITVFIALPLSAWAGSPPLLVKSIEVENSSVTPDEEILRVFRPDEGEAYDPAQVRRSMELISEMPGAEKVDVFRKVEGEALLLKLRVTGHQLIRNLSFSGLSALDKDEVLVGMITGVDRPFKVQFIEADIGMIARMYQRVGYADARIEYRVEETNNPSWIKLHIEITEGEPTRVVAYGNLGDAEKIGTDQVLMRLGMGMGMVANEERLRNGVKALRSWLWQQNYPEARVEGSKLERVEGGFKVHAPLKLGVATKVRITTSQSWKIPELIEIVERNYGDEIDEYWLNRVVRELEEEMRREGFMHARVMASDVMKEGLRVIDFKVNEEQRVTLDNVFFEGLELIDDDELEDLMDSLELRLIWNPVLDKKILESDIERLKRYCVAQGFLDAQVKLGRIEIAPDGVANVVISVVEGAQYSYGKISVDTDDVFDEEFALGVADIESGSPADPSKLDRARLKLLAELSKKGYVGSYVRFKPTVNPRTNAVAVEFKMKRGRLRRFGRIVVAGNARTDPKVVLRELTFEEGDPWNPQQVLKSRRQIMKLGFLSQVKIEPADSGEEAEETDVVVRVVEQNAGWLEFGGGYETDVGVKAFIEIGHSNIMGAGRTLSARIEQEGSGRTYSINYLEPWLLDSPLDLRVSLINQEKERTSYTLDSNALQTSLDYEITEQLSISLIHTLSDNKLTEVPDEAVISIHDGHRYTLSEIGPNLVWDSRDDPFNPTWGYYHSFQAEYALEDLSSDVGYGRYVGVMSGYYSLSRLTLALLARGGYVDMFSDDVSMPIDRRFYLGGRTTVRGFARDTVGPLTSEGDPIGGDAMLNLKAELRFPIYGDLGGALFWDAGQVWLKKLNDPDMDDIRQAAGAGLRFITPVGPISLDVGYKLDKKKGEDASEWHFTIGNVF